MYKRYELMSLWCAVLSAFFYWTFVIPVAGLVAGLIAIGVRNEDSRLWKPIATTVLSLLWLVVAFANLALGRL